MIDRAETERHPEFLAGGGEMGRMIRAHDWAATPLGAPDTWPQSLRSALSICLHSAFPTAIYWGPELRLLYNDAWSPIPADRHPWALGRPGAEVWRDIWDVVGPQFERVMATGEGFSAYDQLLMMERDGVPAETYWNYSFTAIRGEDGSVVGIFNQGNETTAAVLARRAAQAEIERLARMFAEAPSAVAVLRGPGHVFELANPAYEALVGRGNLIGRSVAEALPEVVAQGFTELLDSVLASGEPYVGRAVPVALERDGRIEERLLDFVYQPLYDTEGLPSGIFVQATDVTGIGRAEAALRISDAFNRSVVESSSDCIKVLSYDGSVEFMNENGRILLEIDDLSTVLGQDWPTLWPQESRLMIMEAMEAARNGGMGRFSGYCPTAKGTPKWWDVAVTPVPDADGAPARLLAISRDVTERRRAEEARQLVLRELNHRVKNLFAITSGMITVTARSAPSVETMADVLKGRLNALAKAHELIRAAIVSDAQEQQTASLRELLAEVVKPHLTAEDASQLTLAGDDFDMGPSSATSLALIFHELATNAAKYGALASAEGSLSVTWRIEGGELAIVWQETVPAGGIAEPTSSGFGSRLARSSATGPLGGDIAYEWRDEGVVIRLKAKLSQLER